MQDYIPKFKELRTKVHALNDTRACVPIAVSACYELPIEDVLKLFETFGRKTGNGTRENTTLAVLDYLARVNGIQYSKIRFDGNITARNAWKTLGTSGSFMLMNNSHCAALINGSIVDWSNDRLVRYQYAYKVEKQSTQIPGFFDFKL